MKCIPWQEWQHPNCNPPSSCNDPWHKTPYFLLRVTKRATNLISFSRCTFCWRKKRSEHILQCEIRHSGGLSLHRSMWVLRLQGHKAVGPLLCSRFCSVNKMRVGKNCIELSILAYSRQCTLTSLWTTFEIMWLTTWEQFWRVKKNGISWTEEKKQWF